MDLPLGLRRQALGLGFATPAAKAWVNGGAPTTRLPEGRRRRPPRPGSTPRSPGNALVDWLFMLGLLGIGVALVAGIGLRVAAGASTLMMLMMWGAEPPLDTNPCMDDRSSTPSSSSAWPPRRPATPGAWAAGGPASPSSGKYPVLK